MGQYPRKGIFKEGSFQGGEYWRMSGTQYLTSGFSKKEKYPRMGIPEEWGYPRR